MLHALRAVRPPLAIVADEEGLKPFETDAFISHRETPMLAVLPESEAQVREIVRACRALGVPVVSRGAGTGISGGAIPQHRRRAARALAAWAASLALDARRARRRSSRACAT